MKYLRFLFFVLAFFAVSIAAAQIPAPMNLTAVFEGNNVGVVGNVKLQWQMPTAGQWMFRVYRSANDTAHYQQIAMGVREMMYRDFAVAPGTRYYYYVRAASVVSPEILGPRSNVASVLVPLPPPRIRGFISGTVTDDSTGLPIRNVRIKFFRLSGPMANMMVAFTDSLGHYRAVLDSGRYIVRAEPMCTSTVLCYYPEYFDNVREPQLATVIVVGDSTNFIANFGLSRVVPPTFAYLRGTVTDTLNHPLARARVSLLRPMQEMASITANGGTVGGEETMNLDGLGFTAGVMWSGYTDSLGRYSARLIVGRDYIAVASKEGFIPEYYNNKPTPQLADIIHFTHDTSGIDFSLSVRPLPQNSIAGQIRDSLGQGVPSRVYLYPARPSPVIGFALRYVHTDSLGNYIINNVVAGKYFVSAFPFQGYAPAYYKANACGVSRRDQADTVTITGNVTNINVCVRAILSTGLARVSGTVRTTANVAVRGTVVLAETQDGMLAGIGVSDPSGMYSIEAMAPGSFVLTADRDGYMVATSNLNISPTTWTVDNVTIILTPAGVTSVGEEHAVPRTFALEQNYPNPFNPSTTISFSLAAPGPTTLKVYNLLGQEVATLVNENLAAGTHRYAFDASGFSSGIYIYKLHSGSFVGTRKMILVK